MIRLYDAHNHLHDERLTDVRNHIVNDVEARPTVCVVNGSCEEDWPQVLELARSHAWVLPSFGYHPWYVDHASPEWERQLEHFLDAAPAAVGEIGLDRWITPHDDERQELFFLRQLEIAKARELPVTIHCLRAFGRLLELLGDTALPSSGFLLHSYGGSAELVPQFAELGAYFSFPGFFLGEGKQRKQEAFKAVPLERLLIETDAPDQVLPSNLERYSLPPSSEGRRVNDPRNLRVVYEGVSELLGVELEQLSAQVEENFMRLFGACFLGSAIGSDKTSSGSG